MIFLLRRTEKRSRATRVRGGIKENQLRPTLELTTRGLIPENRHRSKFQKEWKILSEIPPEIICFKVTLGQKSEELGPASTLWGQTEWRQEKELELNNGANPTRLWLGLGEIRIKNLGFVNLSICLLSYLLSFPSVFLFVFVFFFKNSSKSQLNPEESWVPTPKSR